MPVPDEECTPTAGTRIAGAGTVGPYRDAVRSHSRRQPVVGRPGDATVEAQLGKILERILGNDQGAGRYRQPIMESRQQEAKRCAASEHRQRVDLLRVLSGRTALYA